MTIENPFVSFGRYLRFCLAIIGRIFGRRVLSVLGETLRQAGILISGSLLIILGLVFILGLQCGIEGAYGAAAVGSASTAGAFTALCDLREVTPYAFGYMMAAKVGTGLVAELGSMRVTEEIDAIDVMGIDSITYLCTTRLLAMWAVLPFVYITAVAIGFIGSYIAVVRQVAQVSPGGYWQLFWMFQNPGDLLFSAIKSMAMATAIVLTGVYYGYFAHGGPVGVGRATAKSMVANILSIHIIGMLGTQLFWGGNPRAPIGG